MPLKFSQRITFVTRAIGLSLLVHSEFSYKTIKNTESHYSVLKKIIFTLFLYFSSVQIV